MTRLAWRVEPRDAPGSGERALAFRPDDGAFELYNDYLEGVAVLRPGPFGPAPGSARSADGTRPLAPEASIDGYGTFTFPYGPISMGVPEAGRFDLRTYGERILAVSPVGGFKARHIAEGALGLTVEDAALRVERTAGSVSASHVAAFLAAAEAAEGRGVPTPELFVRVLAQELQRIYNHLRLIARIAEAASQNVGLSQTHALGEEVLRLQASIFGHRWLFGALLPGGPARHLDARDRRAAASRLDRIASEFDALWELFLESRTFIDRIQSTGPLSRADVVRGGAVGPTLRASGVGWDDRLRVPTLPYLDLFVALPNESAGDALARVLVRGAEIRASRLILEQLFDRWPAEGGPPEPPAAPLAPGRGLARVEAPSGDLVYDVTIADHRIRALGVRTPSQANWPVFAASLRDAVFTDFHFDFESFGLLFAETDG